MTSPTATSTTGRRSNPTGATFVGITGYDDQLDDLSPDGFAAQAELNRRTLADLDVTRTGRPTPERVAKEAMQERLGLELARYDAGETTSELNVISSGAARAPRRSST